MYYFIYQTTNLINNKKYIGQHQTENIDDGYLGSGVLLQKAIKKYGKENFSRQILCFANNKDELDSLEIAYIAAAQARESDQYYNLNDGGLGQRGFVMPEEQKKAISESEKEAYRSGRRKYVQRVITDEERKQKSETAKRLYAEGKIIPPMKGKFGRDNPAYGRKMTDEQKAVLSQKAKERYASGFDKSKIFTAERSRKISETRKKNYAAGKYTIPDISGERNPMYGKCGELNPRFGVKLTQDERDCLSKIAKESYQNGRIPPMLGKKWDQSTRTKMSQSHKGLVEGCNNPNFGKGRQTGKAVYCIEKDQIYSSIAKAAQDNNCWPHQITKCLQGLRETAGNCHWEYASQVNTVPSS